MGKTTDAYGNKRSFKQSTKTAKFAAFVEGEYQETMAVNEGQAWHAFKARYNEEHGRIKSAYVTIEFTEPREAPTTSITVTLNPTPLPLKEKKLTKKQIVYNNPQQFILFED